MGINLPIADISQVSQNDGLWFTTGAGSTLWTEIAKTAPDGSGRFVQSRGAGGNTWPSNANEDDITIRMAAVAQPGVTTGHQVVIECWLLNPGAQTVTLSVIDGNTSAVLSTGTISPNQTPTVYTFALSSADVAGNFLTSSYGNIWIKVARNNTPSPQDLYVDLLQFVTPNTDAFGSAGFAGQLSMTAQGGVEYAGSASFAGTLAMTATGGTGDVFGSASFAGSLSMSATGGIEVGASVTFSGTLGITLGRPTLEPQSRRDIPFASPLGKPISRRDQ